MIVRRSRVRRIGVEEIEVLQDELLDRASQLVEAASARQPREARAHVERMREVATVLFAAEERHLRAAGSRSLERHSHEHRRFLEDLAVVRDELGVKGERALTDLQVARWVAAWVDAHVGHTHRDLEQIAEAVG